jgi:hypothetical protein
VIPWRGWEPARGHGKAPQPVEVTGPFWLRGWDLNPRPSGYEPDELPDCSTPRQVRAAGPAGAGRRRAGSRDGQMSDVRAQMSDRPGPEPLLCGICRLTFGSGALARPGDDPLSHPSKGSTLGAAGFHGRVRNGIGWAPRAMITRPGQRSRDQRSDIRGQRGRTRRLLTDICHLSSVCLGLGAGCSRSSD